MTVRVIVGDCRSVLADLPNASVQCCVTSPPYFGLRDYQVQGQIGLELTPDAYVAEMVAVFREVRRVLRADGTCWLNLGDSYASNAGGRAGDVIGLDGYERPGRLNRQRSAVRTATIKPKDLMLIPARVAIALQEDGWWVRSAIVWEKPSPMPESVDDRPTSSYENVFLLTKSGSPLFWTHRDGRGARTLPTPDYRWFDRDADAESTIEPDDWRSARSVFQSGLLRWRRINLWRGEDYFYDAEAIREPTTGGAHSRGSGVNPKALVDGLKQKQNSSWSAAVTQPIAARNRRNVWRIGSEPFKESHFATMPPALAAECIKAGTSGCGGCSCCGAPFVRVTEKGVPDLERQRQCGGDAVGQYHGKSTKDHAAAGVQDASAVKARILAGMVERVTVGWVPSCTCPEANPVPQIVLDPFGGAGTTGLAADRLGRNAILIELNPKYASMARARISGEVPLLAEVAD